MIFEQSILILIVDNVHNSHPLHTFLYSYLCSSFLLKIGALKSTRRDLQTKIKGPTETDVPLHDLHQLAESV